MCSDTAANTDAGTKSQSISGIIRNRNTLAESGKEMKMTKFKVIDVMTGVEADPYKIALKEPWAQHLMYCDMEGFAILEDGTLMLTDECGKYEFCPEGRFVVKWEVEQDG